MMTALLRAHRAHRRRGDDGGFSMILVMGFMLVVSILVVGALGVADNSLHSSSQHVTFEQALAVAEDGIDQGLARLQTAYTTYVTDYPVPDVVSPTDPSPLCTADPSAWEAPAGGFATPDDERAWARGELTALASAHPECIRKAVGGEYLTFKPANRHTVYSIGWVPSYANPQKTRLVKAEYIFAPWRPAVAVLTGGDVELDSSTTITNIDGSTDEGGVHSNGTVTVAGGNPTVYGEVSSSDPSSASSNNFMSNQPTGEVTTQAPMKLPAVSPRYVYLTQWQDFGAAAWYDLCPDGKVMVPSAAGPCANTDPTAIEADLSAGGTFRGWSFGHDADGVATWYATKDLLGNAVYYVHEGNIAMAGGVGNPTVDNMTLIASSQEPDPCPNDTGQQKVGGNIDWDRINITAPKIPNLFMLAQADLTTGSNFSAGSATNMGQFVAGDQINMQTSSSGAWGSVVAADECAPEAGEVDVVKNPEIHFGPDTDSPFSSIIDTTLWLEYVGN